MSLAMLPLFILKILKQMCWFPTPVFHSIIVVSLTSTGCLFLSIITKHPHFCSYYLQPNSQHVA
jgi:hypothetical protein